MWLRFSLRKYFPILTLISLIGLMNETLIKANKDKSMKVSDEEIGLIHYRYLKEMSSNINI